MIGNLSFIWKLISVLSFCPFYCVYATTSDENNDKIGSIWENAWSMSCEYVNNHLESSHPHRVERSSDKLKNIDFNDAEQLFNYLYPLAQVQMKDLIKENNDGENNGEGRDGRSNKNNNSPLHYSVSTLISDLLEFWQTECELGDMSKDKDNESETRVDDDTGSETEEDEDSNEEYMEAEEDEEDQVLDDDDERDPSQARRPRLRQIAPQRRQTEEGSPQINLYSYNDEAVRPDQTPSMRSYFNSLKSTNPNYTNASTNTLARGAGKILNRRRRKKKKHHPGIRRSDSNNTTANPNGTTTTTTPATATPKSEDDNFFSSYGGDIEYFFPLLSFGIPFDGEITFLGFHGFKGLFPYRR